MATLPLDVRPANPARAFSAPPTRDALHPAPRADNDNFRPWTADPRAAILLASCAANPPAGHWERARFGNAVDEWWTYTGYRFEALTAIHEAIGDRLWLDHQMHGDEAYPAFRAWCRQPRPTDAIDAVLTPDAREG
jgi:hypothetical protein